MSKPARAQASHPLGPVIAIYRDRPLRWRDLFLLFIPAALAVLIPLLYGLRRTLYARAYYGPAPAQVWGRAWFELAALALIPLLLLALRRVRRARRVVVLRKGGVQIRWHGGVRLDLHWEQIAGIACDQEVRTFMGRALHTHTRLTIFPQSGAQIRLDDRLPGLNELTARLKARLYPRWLPALRTAYRRGEALPFGPLTLRPEGLRLREVEILWEAVAHLEVEDGHLKISTTQGRKYKLPAGKIPNVELFIQLLQEEAAP